MSPAPLNSPPTERPPRAVAVYCGASPGTSTAFHHAAVSLGQALATLGRPLVYGGGRRGIMGIISSAVLNHGGHVTAVVPSAMLRAGGEGEGDQATGGHIDLAEGHEKVQLLRHAAVGQKLGGSELHLNLDDVVVDSMHERKVEMVRRVCGFIGLPGGYGTFEEIMEAITWTQLGIHAKPVVIMNVLGFYDPLRAQIKGAVASGFIKPSNERLVIFIDGPPGTDPTDFDWGTAALTALDAWSPPGPGIFSWNKNTAVKL
ncbi:hypothetical protein EDB92DRAFT_1945854 [Lactarius akahatsu]|uniref:Cytokinin riboside 5'-monophosphate phosphoribohydrolase n=1 Tax=Lactarius akahatsu TaxID=416441 RepID=A0AAD4LFF9_9AGAM|nr:hypothetical protein EDB92DRAFT_1945854 [Lactarius akahatsu]